MEKDYIESKIYLIYLGITPNGRFDKFFWLSVLSNNFICNFLKMRGLAKSSD